MTFLHGIVILSLLFNFEIVLIQLVFPLEDFGRRCGVLYFFPSYLSKKKKSCSVDWHETEIYKILGSQLFFQNLEHIFWHLLFYGEA